MDILLDEPVNGSGDIRIGGHGLTLMRLTYTYDLDTGNKQRIFNRILSENRIQEQHGRLYIEAQPERLYPSLLQFAQTVAEVSSMQYYKREVVQNLFYEQLAEFVEEKLARHRAGTPCRFWTTTLRGELPVRYRPAPLFLFGVKDNDNARLASFSCLEFQRRRIPLKGVMVQPELRERDHEKGSCPDHQRLREAVSVARRLPGERPAVLRT